MEREVQGYLTEFGISRGYIRDAIQGLNDEAANWRPLPEGTNSINAILAHLAGAQNFWVRRVIAGETVQRNREAEFHTSGRLSELLDQWEKVCMETDAILGKLTAAQLAETRAVPEFFTGLVTVQWCILHRISHHTIHLGHIQLTRQLWDHRLLQKEKRL